MRTVLIVLVGKPGVGKTAVRKHLAAKLDAQSVSPDDHADRWQWVYTQLHQADRAIVECGRIPGKLWTLLSQRPHRIILLTCPDKTRRQRLRARGEHGQRLAKLMKDSGRLAYGGTDAQPDVTVNTTGSLDTTVQACCDASQGTGGTLEESGPGTAEGVRFLSPKSKNPVSVTKKRPSASRRGYGARHRTLRAQWARKVKAGGVVCARPGCGEPILPGDEWDLGHDDFDRSRYHGPEHARCNRSAGGKSAHVVRADNPSEDWF